MKHTQPTIEVRRRPVTLSIREDIIANAKEFGLNASQAAEAGIHAAIREARAAAWLAENKDAIDAYNKAVDTKGLPLNPLWQDRT